MAKLPTTFPVGDRDDISPERLLEMIEDMYSKLANAINEKPTVYQRNVAGTPSDGDTGDTFVAVGDINVNTTSDKVEMCTQHDSVSTVVWTQLS